ncbi:MAG: hypothetical protein KBT39_06820, partial [Bacteroidales bacterium]|nr:hypothetical protein [Bacteroidales bacterium]
FSASEQNLSKEVFERSILSAGGLKSQKLIAQWHRLGARKKHLVSCRLEKPKAHSPMASPWGQERTYMEKTSSTLCQLAVPNPKSSHR